MLFKPSIATSNLAEFRGSSAVRSLQFLGDTGIAFVSSLARSFLGPLIDTAPAPRALEATSQELVSTLVTKGMPIAALSDILHVERKTVYSWLDDGRDAKQENHDRLKLVHSLLAGERDGSLRFFHRFWNRELADVGSLKSQLTSVAIDEQAVAVALDALRPAVERALAADAGRKAKTTVRSPAASLTILLEVTS